jgi:hypothetical protein
VLTQIGPNFPARRIFNSRVKTWLVVVGFVVPIILITIRESYILIFGHFDIPRLIFICIVIVFLSIVVLYMSRIVRRAAANNSWDLPITELKGAELRDVAVLMLILLALLDALCGDIAG